MITKVSVSDRRFPLEDGAGTDSIHTQPVYAYAVCDLNTDAGMTGIGLAFTLGRGNDLVCRAITALAEPLVGRDIETVMADFGNVFRSIADNQHYRWLGPHKGVVHLALAAISNACFDLWANAKRTIEQGFDAMKLKVGSRDVERDIRRANLIRETVGGVSEFLTVSLLARKFGLKMDYRYLQIRW
jgi:L-alanine-DL-glutamate epimerase-like enolase superfamily enzyme